MTPPPSDITMVCCSVFAAEVQSLLPAHWPGVRLRLLTSMLHIHPCRLAQTLQDAVEHELAQHRRVAIIYGDCCMQMTALEARPGVVRTRGKNCCEIVLGPAEYRRLSHQGAFFLLPEWTRRWREVFTRELGLPQDTARSLLQDMHSRMLYLDTGVVAVPERLLEEIHDFSGLPIEVRPTGVDLLRQAIDEALSRLAPAQGVRP